MREFGVKLDKARENRIAMELVTKLGHDVKIVVGPVRRRAGNIELQLNGIVINDYWQSVAEGA